MVQERPASPAQSSEVFCAVGLEQADHLNAAMHMRIELASGAYTAAKVCLRMLHGFCGAFLVATGRLYWYLEHPYLAYYADLVAPSSKRHFKLLGTVLVGVGLLHLIEFAALVHSSTPCRQRHAPIAPEMQAGSTRDVAKTRFSSACFVFRQFAVKWDQLFGRKSILGVESVHFELVFIGRELAEITSQIYQAYRSSHLIGRVWINHCYVLIVVLNCWSTPLTQRIFQHCPPAQRAACLTIDFLLNICSSVVLPMVIFIPYLYHYEVEGFTFDMAFIYGDVSFGSLVLENQSIFAVSLLDCGSKLIPHLSVYSGLRTVNSLLQRNPDTTGFSTRKSKTRAASSSSPSALGPMAFLVPFKPSRSCQLLHLIFVLFGLSILCVHLTAVLKSHGLSDSGCKQKMHPWFAEKYACSVYEFSCYRHNETPSLDAQSLDFLDEDALTVLVISHCPALIVPKSIRNFPNLLGIEVYNSTITEWSREASISASIHQQMVYSILFRVNMTKVPDGLLEPLPPMLQDFEFSVTNLTALPEDLHERWHALSIFYLEYSQIQIFPETLLQLEVYELSLIGNQLETIPDLLSVQSSYHEIALGFNPLKALPPAIASGLVFAFLQLENTSVQELPDWVAESVQDVVYLSGTPFCASYEDEKDPETKSAKIICNERDPRGAGMYPQELVTPQRQL